MDADRFRALDGLEPPDRWSEITDRAADARPPACDAPPAGPRTLVAAIVVVVLAVVATGAVLVARGGGSQVVRSVANGAASTRPIAGGGPAAAPTAPAAPDACAIGTGTAPAGGSARLLGQVSAPAIGLRRVSYLEGTDAATMQRGIGHEPSTPLPGGAGNAVLVGHRTTFGAPFHDLDHLRPGDAVTVSSPLGAATYDVRSSRVTTPDDQTVLADAGDDRLTLVTCDPRSSDRRRLVVVAILVGSPRPLAAPAGSPSGPTVPSTGAAAPGVATVIESCVRADGAPARIVARGTVAGGPTGARRYVVSLEVVDRSGQRQGSAYVTVAAARGAAVPFRITVATTGDTSTSSCRLVRAWAISR